MRRLILVRHGRSAHVHDGRWLSAADVERWLTDYDVAGIRDGDAPPASLVQAARAADLILASDLARAVASAERLAQGRIVRVSPLLREIPLAIPPSRFSWPIWVWAAALHVKWGLAVRREPEVGHRSRVVAAADWLIETVQEGETAIVVTHGLFRRQLGLYLTTVGWTAATRARGYAHWSAWEFAT